MWTNETELSGAPYKKELGAYFPKVSISNRSIGSLLSGFRQHPEANELWDKYEAEPDYFVVKYASMNKMGRIKEESLIASVGASKNHMEAQNPGKVTLITFIICLTIWGVIYLLHR